MDAQRTSASGIVPVRYNTRQRVPRLAIDKSACQSPTVMSNQSSSPQAQAPLRLIARNPLKGTIRVPGDKSISHRALIFASLAVGRSEIHDLLEGEDILNTAAAMRAMGATIERLGPGHWTVDGVGVGTLLQPEQALEMGNSGTSARLLMGLVSTHPIKTTFVGDVSLSKRPMRRVTEPLSLTGAEFNTAPGDRLPLTVNGISPAIPVRYRLPVASAQVKSALLLAALNIAGETVVEEPVLTRDHSERMLAGFGADIEVEVLDGVRHIRLRGPAELKPQSFSVPGDPSSAAFPLVAALLVPESDILIEAVCINPTRDGIIHALNMMGADIKILNKRTIGGEPVADLHVRSAKLQGIEVPPEIAPSMIDEYPILFVAAALAHGKTTMRGIEELRVKESDRISVMAQGLQACGIKVEEFEDGLAIEGSGGEPVPGGATVETHLDHRIAMSFAILSLACETPVTVADPSPIATSFPDFLPLMTGLGAQKL